jgi:hypothetical protein
MLASASNAVTEALIAASGVLSSCETDEMPHQHLCLVTAQYTHQYGFGRGAWNRILVEIMVFLKLALCVHGHPTQRQLAQGGQILDAEKAIKRSLDLLLGLNVAPSQALAQRIWCLIDHFEVVRRFQHPVW